MSEEPLSYASAGVDIELAQTSLRGITDRVQATHGESVLGGIGGFGAMFSASFPEMAQPVLVSSIDGVGTKTKVAAMVGDGASLGHDIVNHCVNDILCQGARPLFFLDYFGCSRLEPAIFEQVVGGAADACAAVGCALIGGETAEMPGVYADGEIDVVGSIVGVVDYERRLPRAKPSPNDRLIGIASTGLHTNGFSLARKALFEVAGYSVRDEMPDGSCTIGDALLAPHKCYFNSVYPLLQEFDGIYGVAHITGGGIYDNLPRVLPLDMQAKVLRRSWNPLPIFQLIQQAGSIPDVEMFRAFNMGIGMILVVDAEIADIVVGRLNAADCHAAEIGKLQSGPKDVQII